MSCVTKQAQVNDFHLIFQASCNVFGIVPAIFIDL